MVLTQEEIDQCREAFLAFDKDRSGTIDVWELRQVLEAMGKCPTEEELFQVRYLGRILGLLLKFSLLLFFFTCVFRTRLLATRWEIIDAF